MLEAKANWLGKRTLNPVRGAFQLSTGLSTGWRAGIGADQMASGLGGSWSGAVQLPSGASSSSYPDGHIDDLAAQVGNVLANVFGTELVCRTVEILRQLHADVVRAWLRAPVA